MAETTKRKPRSLALVVLAAGKGKRMRSATPKVLHPIAGRAALWHVFQTGMAAKPTKIIVVVGHDAPQVEAEVRSWGLSPKPVFVVQRPQRGTAHAVEVAKSAVGRATDVLVANGDFDPVSQDDVRALLRSHRRTGAAATLLTTELDDPGTYGRVIRDARGRFVEIDEDLETPGADAIREVGTNWIAFSRGSLFATLPLVDAKTKQRERYLNRVYPLMRERGERVDAVLADTGGVMGVNSRTGLAGLEALMRDRINAAHMANGVTIVDPATTYIDIDV
ncbi:MAG: NTP transferase domain-containing protein, partial [Myxococcota bacterium]